MIPNKGDVVAINPKLNPQRVIRRPPPTLSPQRVIPEVDINHRRRHRTGGVDLDRPTGEETDGDLNWEAVHQRRFAPAISRFRRLGVRWCSERE